MAAAARDHDDAAPISAVHTGADLARLRRTHARTVVMYGAAWCPSCRAIRPTWEALARRCGRGVDPTAVFDTSVGFASADVDNDPELAAAAAIAAVPTFVAYGRDGSRLEALCGADATALGDLVLRCQAPPGSVASAVKATPTPPPGVSPSPVDPAAPPPPLPGDDDAVLPDNEGAPPPPAGEPGC